VSLCREPTDTAFTVTNRSLQACYNLKAIKLPPSFIKHKFDKRGIQSLYECEHATARAVTQVKLEINLS